MERVTFGFLTRDFNLVPLHCALQSAPEDLKLNEYSSLFGPEGMQATFPLVQVGNAFGARLIERGFKLVAVRFCVEGSTEADEADDTYRVVIDFSREKGANRHRYQLSHLERLFRVTAMCAQIFTDCETTHSCVLLWGVTTTDNYQPEHVLHMSEGKMWVNPRGRSEHVH